jgi:CheY-like chemotaxis protein
MVMPYEILVVDDNDLNLLLLEKLLKMEGYRVVTAHNGREAIHLIQVRKPDLAILDVMMPEIGGYELCRKFREPPYSLQIPIVMLTAASDIDEERRRAQKAGANDVWVKPFDMNILRSDLNGLLKID